MQSMQRNISNNLNGANQRIEKTVETVTNYPKAQPIKQSQDYHKQFVSNTEYISQAPKKTLETVIERPNQEIITETITTTKPIQTSYQNNMENLGSNKMQNLNSNKIQNSYQNNLQNGANKIQNSYQNNLQNETNQIQNSYQNNLQNGTNKIQNSYQNTQNLDSNKIKNYTSNKIQNLDSNNKVIEKVITTTTTTNVNKNLNNLNPKYQNNQVIKEVKEEIITHKNPNTYIKREFKRPEKNDPNLFSVERNFVKDTAIDNLQPMKQQEQKKIIVLDEKKEISKPVVTEYIPETKKVVRRIYVRDEEKNTVPEDLEWKNRVVEEEIDLKAQNRELMRKNEELANRLNYIGNYEKAVDRNIKINAKKGDHDLEGLNNKITHLVSENNKLKNRINRGEDVSQDLSKMDITIDEIEQKHLTSIKGKLVEKNLKIKKLNNQLKAYTKETTTMEDYLHLKNEADRLRGEKNALELRRTDLEDRMNNQAREINRLKQENNNLRNSLTANLTESKTIRNIKYAPEGLVTRRKYVTSNKTANTGRYTRNPSYPKNSQSITTTRISRKPSTSNSRKLSSNPTGRTSEYSQLQKKYEYTSTTNPTYTTEIPKTSQYEHTTTEYNPITKRSNSRLNSTPSDSKTIQTKTSNSQQNQNPSNYKTIKTKRSSPRVNLNPSSGYKTVETKRSSSRVNLNPDEYKKRDNGVYQVVNHPLIVRREQTDGQGHKRITVNQYDADDYSTIVLDQEVQTKKRGKEDFLTKTTESGYKNMGDRVKTTTVKTTTIEEVQ